MNIIEQILKQPKNIGLECRITITFDSNKQVFIASLFDNVSMTNVVAESKESAGNALFFLESKIEEINKRHEE